MITKYDDFIRERFDLVIGQSVHGKENVNNYKNLWPKLDEINGDLSKEQILYALSELIDDDIIEVININKIYMLSELKSTTSSPTVDSDGYLAQDEVEMKKYLQYKIIVSVRIKRYKGDTQEDYDRKKARYVEYRNTTFKEIMNDVYSHRMLNTWIHKMLIAGKYKYFDTHRVEGLDEFDLWSKSLFI